jgi:ribosome maturation factor RimP
MVLKEQIAQITQELLTTLPEYFLVEIKISSNHHRVLVVIDSDTGVDIEHCTALSHQIGDTIEQNNWIENAYNLEVSSPGADQPLRLLRQYSKHIGRTLHTTTTDGTVYIGKLVAISENEEICLELPKPKKKNQEIIPNPVVPFGDIKEAKVQIEFK